jgi:hypothetical protein
MGCGCNKNKKFKRQQSSRINVSPRKKIQPCPKETKSEKRIKELTRPIFEKRMLDAKAQMMKQKNTRKQTIQNLKQKTWSEFSKEKKK